MNIKEKIVRNKQAGKNFKFDKRTCWKKFYRSGAKSKFDK